MKTFDPVQLAIPFFVLAVILEIVLARMGKANARYERERANHPAEQFIDLDYQEFVSDPVGTTKRIYETFDIEWTPAVDEAVTKLDAESRQGGRRPSHQYDLADYGLTQDEVRAAFA